MHSTQLHAYSTGQRLRMKHETFLPPQIMEWDRLAQVYLCRNPRKRVSLAYSNRPVKRYVRWRRILRVASGLYE